MSLQTNQSAQQGSSTLRLKHVVLRKSPCIYLLLKRNTTKPMPQTAIGKHQFLRQCLMNYFCTEFCVFYGEA